jgi:3'-phosphoadenosine 5'-phosphosulfate sulfotransferase (PAPS reductase)/FAD synthetase
MRGLDSKIAETKDLLQQIMTSHEKVALFLSGGKDSTTLLHLAQEWASRLTVLSVIMDNTHPGIPEHVETICREWGYTDVHLLSPPVDFWTYVKNYGWPMQLIPTSMNGEMLDPYYDGGPKVASWWHCSTVRVLWPLAEATQQIGADAVLTASRASDAPEHVRRGPITETHGVPFAGWTRYDAIWPWTTAQVYAYVDKYNISLPPISIAKRAHPDVEFSDCVECLWHSGYATWLKENDPETFARVWAMAGPVVAHMKAKAEGELAQWVDLLNLPVR